MTKEQSLDAIFDELDDLLLAGDFDGCDKLLIEMEVSQFSNAELLTALTATAGAKDKLAYRSAFFARCFSVIDSRAQNARLLTQGLE